ncbi:RNase H family protein [Chloroflexota bacterium]
MSDHPHVEVFTDSTYSKKSGKGGYAAILKCGEHEKEVAGGFRLTAVGRMDLMAAIAGLQALKKYCQVSVYSDSVYLVDSMVKRLPKTWRENSWIRSNSHGKPGGGGQVKNGDLWERLLELCEGHEVAFKWIQGHCGQNENDRCDKLANQWAQQTILPNDEGYQREIGSLWLGTTDR